MQSRTYKRYIIQIIQLYVYVYGYECAHDDDEDHHFHSHARVHLISIYYLFFVINVAQRSNNNY